MTYLALLTALAVVLTRYASVRVSFAGVENVRFGFGQFPAIMAGVLYGPWGGAAVGALADVVGYLLSPIGPYMPHFTLTAALTGALPALFLAVLRPKRVSAPSFGHLLLAVGLAQALVAIGLTPYFLKILFGMPWAVTVIPRVVAQAILIPVYASLLHLIIRSVSDLAPVWTQPAAREVAAAKK